MNAQGRVVRVHELDAQVLPHSLWDATEPYLFLLDCPVEPTSTTRWSYLCAEPYFVLWSRGGRCFGGPPGAARPLDGGPFDELERLMTAFPAFGRRPSSIPFLGGAVGYLGYELLHELEEVPGRQGASPPRRADAVRTPEAEEAAPDCFFAFCHQLLVSDLQEGRSFVVTHGLGLTEEDAGREADRHLSLMLERVRVCSLRTHGGETSSTPSPETPGRSPRRAAPLAEAALEREGIHPVLTPDEYRARVRMAREHILAGDVFEVCTTQRFEVTDPPDGERLYGALRAVNPEPYAAHLRVPGVEVLCASPERFLRLSPDGWAESRPIKGTRPRGATPEEDASLRDELAASAKDHAENLMIVDLARNDLGRVCRFGSVEVPELAVVESHPFTHQLVSTVRGRLEPDVGPVDLLRATFPPGSMTGAPKVEAMTLIYGLEPVPRGVYSGALGYVDFDGALDLAVVIRTFVRVGSRLTFHVGGAVVADSDPEEEYRETLDKAQGLLAALGRARRASGRLDEEE